MNCTKNMNKSYEKINYLRFPVLGLIALFPRRGLAKSQGHLSGKADQFAGFPRITTQEFTHEE